MLLPQALCLEALPSHSCLRSGLCSESPSPCLLLHKVTHSARAHCLLLLRAHCHLTRTDWSHYVQPPVHSVMSSRRPCLLIAAFQTCANTWVSDLSIFLEEGYLRAQALSQRGAYPQSYIVPTTVYWSRPCYSSVLCVLQQKDYVTIMLGQNTFF